MHAGSVVRPLTIKLPGVGVVRCSAITRAGGHCRAPVVRGTSLCVRHSTDPVLRERALEGSSRGGRNRAIERVTAAPIEADDLNLETPAGLSTYLARALKALATLPFDVRVANAMAQLVNSQRAGIEIADIERRLNNLEAREENHGS